MPDARTLALTGLNIAAGRGLEIGPLNRPLLPLSPGRIFSADHCSTQELKAKYEADPGVQTDDIRNVDFDLSQIDLSATAREGLFDYVVASHVIEHVPDLVGWLQTIHEILGEGGVLALVVPDKRFTFDVFRRESTFWMVSDAVGRSRPGIELVIDHFVNMVDADAGQLWADSTSRHNFRRAIGPEVCPDLIERHRQGEYIDAHCWVFTPSSFLQLVGEIVGHYNLGYELAFFKSTLRGQLEFYVQLKKSSVTTDWVASARQAAKVETNTNNDTELVLSPGLLNRLRKRLFPG